MLSLSREAAAMRAQEVFIESEVREVVRGQIL